MIKEWTFEDLPTPNVTLDLYYSYYYKPAKLNGLPENCCPEEEESEIQLPNQLENIVITAYLKAARQAIKVIADKVQDMDFDGLPREWAERVARG